MARDPRIEAQRILNLLNSGANKEAHRAAAAAHKAFPREGYFANLLGLAKVNLGNPREAVFAFQKALKQRPGDGDFQRNLLNALISSGQEKKALDIAERILLKRPDDAGLLYVSAVSLFQLGRLDEAAARIEERLRSATGDTAALMLKGRILLALGQTEASIPALRAATEADPRSFDAYVLLAKTCEWAGRLDEAGAALETALALRPGEPEAMNLRARVLTAEGYADRALEIVEQVLLSAPEHEGTLIHHAGLLQETGRMEEAKVAYRRLVSLHPGHADALAGLVRTQSRDEKAEMRKELEKALARTQPDTTAYCTLSLTLAQVFDAVGDWESAATWMERGNRAQARAHPFDTAAAEAEFARMTGLFTMELPALPSRPGPAGPRPVFIIGLPRSGTTLCERMLSAAQGVYPGGELSAGWIAAERHLRHAARLDSDLLAQFAATYLSSLPKAAGGHVAITDKLPENYRITGVLALAFPEAAIINLTRDPRDVALSQWRESFFSPTLGYTYDLETMAGEANRFRRYMNFWHDRFPSRILDVAYEDLVRDVEGVSKRMAAHCGLEWIPAMIRPQDNAAPIRTASLAQARQAVSTGSVGKWQRYESMLAPFIGALDPALWPEQHLAD
jgi:tetratricopeptide (TPR) repeat protein